MRKLLTLIALLLSLSGLVGTAQADGNLLGEPGPRDERRNHRRHTERLLPPDTPYRDLTSRRRGRSAQPGFPIQAYLPRHTETPIYNVPPPRF